MTSRYQLLAQKTSSPGETGRTSASPEPRGEVVAAHRLARDCIVILGWAEGEMAAEGLAASAAKESDRGRFRATSWPNGGGGEERWYVAALRFPEVGEIDPGENLLLQGAGSKIPVSVRLPAAFADAASFATELRSRAKGKLDEAVRFLLETFSSRASRQLQSVGAFLTAVLDSAAQDSGVVEILGAIDGEGLLLQGWLGHPLSGGQRLLLSGVILDEHEAICANFSRTDLDGRGLGMLALVRPKNNTAPDAPRKIYLQAGDRFCRLDVLPNAMRLRIDEAPNHLRTMLPKLLVEEHLQRVLRVAARPRFSGVETVSSLEQPVRMAIDLVVRVPQVGWYLTGWMLDPAKLVAEVTLRGQGVAERLDTRWTRVPRDDVSAGFRGDALFQGLIADDLHGFTVFIPDRASDGEVWLELKFGDDHQAFMPLRAISGDNHDGRMRLVESFDIHKSSAREIVEHHLGPLFHATKSAPKRRVAHRVLRERIAAEQKSDIALVIPITETEPKTKLIVAQLASRDPGPGIVPIFSCSSTIGDGARTLLREIDFYGLDALVLQSAESVSVYEALEIGAYATSAPKLVFMSPTTYSLETHWAAQLAALVGGEGEPAIASPTLLYEDWSVCYGGIDGVRFLDAAPYVDAASTRAGYPRESLRERGATPTLAAALDCCAMLRATFDAVGGFASGYALPRLAGLELFLRMRDAGTRIIWAPQIEAYTLADTATQNEYRNRTAEIVDGWSFRAGWRDRIPEVVNLARHAAMATRDSTDLIKASGTRAG